MKALAPFALLSAGLFGVALAQGAHAPARNTETANVDDGATAAEATALGKRVAKLEKELAEERRANAQTRALLEQTIRYLGKRAERSDEVLQALDAAEKEGFTAGINFRSRELLLGGLRAGWSAQEGLPTLPKETVAPATNSPEGEATPVEASQGEAPATSERDAAEEAEESSAGE